MVSGAAVSVGGVSSPAVSCLASGWACSLADRIHTATAPSNRAASAASTPRRTRSKRLSRPSAAGLTTVVWTLWLSSPVGVSIALVYAMNSVARVSAIRRARSGDSSVTSTSIRDVFGGTFVASIFLASSEVVSGKPSLSTTRWSTTWLVNRGTYELMRPAATSSFWYAAEVVDPSIDTISRVVDTNLAGDRRIQINARTNTAAVMRRNVSLKRRTAARNCLRVKASPSQIDSRRSKHVGYLG